MLGLVDEAFTKEKLSLVRYGSFYFELFGRVFLIILCFLLLLSKNFFIFILGQFQKLKKNFLICQAVSFDEKNAQFRLKHAAAHITATNLARKQRQNKYENHINLK